MDRWQCRFGARSLCRSEDRCGDFWLKVGTEYMTQTDPTVAETDDDGMRDGWEVDYNLNPLIH